MSLLAPLYIAGLLAVSLPILFHLIRRTPQGRQPFSSLMFLVSSPPRLTRRSRLNNLLLLILRGLALTILACAFARPFLYRSADLSVAEQQGRRVALLLDTSASMRRADLWNRATKIVEDSVEQLGPGDELAMFAFDDHVRPLFTFSEWNELSPSARLAALRLQLDAAKPTWRGSNLGDALATVADALADAQTDADAAAV
jgi:Aerotolerance regulator N-terminal/von Willebrand factor type A domain